MPKKICFNVVYATGEEEKYRAFELDRHGPSVKGWQSSRDCVYPQELILKLAAPATLQQIQILAHQFLIPERIDLWIGPDEPGDEPSTLHFDYLGYITLSDNLNTEYKSRELKSITVPAFCPTLYVKLRLHQNHRNALNVYNQVSLVAVQLIGEPVETSENSQNENKNDHTGNYSSACDDLAFEMYVDKDVATNIRKLESRKFQAVQEERFEYARKLKTAMAELRLVGERLGKLEIGKKQAIQNEDYARAKKKKAQMDEYRKESYIALRLTELLEEDGPVAKNDEESPDSNEPAESPIVLQNNIINDAQPAKVVPPNDSLASSPPRLTSSHHSSHQLSSIQQQTNTVQRPQTTPSASQQPNNDLSAVYQPSQSHQTGEQQHLNISDGRVSPALYQSPVSPLHYRAGASSPTGSTNTRSAQPIIAQPVRGGSLRRRNKSAGPVAPTARNSYEAYDERLVPAQRNIHAESTPSLNSTNSKLNERERKQAALPIDVFGMALVEKFYSKQYTDKEEGLRLLQAALRNYTRNACVKPPEHMEVHSPNKLARAAIFLLHRALRDKVFLVYSVSAEVIRYFFSEFVPGRVTMAEVAKSVDKILPELILKSGDTTPRIHNMAVHTILSMADTRDVRSLHVIPVHLTRVLTSSTHPRLAQSRLEMAEQLIINHGISSDKNSGMACRTLAEFGASGLHHPAEAVRKVAERVLLLVYKVNPRLVRKQLPPDDDITRRNLLYRNLMQQFDKIDQQRKEESNLATSADKPKLVRSGSVTGTNPTPAPPPIRVASTGDFAQIKQQASANHPVAHDSPISRSESSSSERSFASPASVDDSRKQQCIFCLERRDDFTEEGLNIHYWKSCPMLTRCHHCQEVVEIASLNQHLIDDCDKRKHYIKCEICGDAVLTEKREEHTLGGRCRSGGGARCPLCRCEVGATESWWREHLTSVDRLCPNHPRRAYVRSAQSRARSPETTDSARHSSLGQANSIYGYC